MKLDKFFRACIIAVLMLTLAAGCSLVRSPIIEPVVLEGSEMDAVLVYAREPAENLLEGLIARDYAQFSRDFTADMKQGMNAQAFDDLLIMLDTKLGAYQSYNLVTALQDENFSTLVYQLIYEKDNEVSMRVVFDNKEPPPDFRVVVRLPELRKD